MHYKFIIFSLSTLFIGFVHNVKNPKIVGGSSGFIPYAVSIFHRQGFYFCGGALISKSVIATTGRCAILFSPKELMVRSGSLYTNKGGTFSPVKKSVVHTNFTINSPDYDVGILLLNDTADEKSRTIKLAEKEVNDGEKILVSGWGSTEENGPLSDKMNSVRISKISLSKCKTFYNGTYEITSRMICGELSGAGVCMGDVGGPVVWKDQLVGMVSFGMGCGKPGHPGVFTNVASSSIKKFLERFIKL